LRLTRGLVAFGLAALAAAGCAYDHHAALGRLRANNPREQTAAIGEVVAADDRAMIPKLFDLLKSEDEGVRFMASAALHRMTGQDFGFQFAKEGERGAIIAKWRRWWEAQGGPSAEAGAQGLPSAPGAERPAATDPAAP